MYAKYMLNMYTRGYEAYVKRLPLSKISSLSEGSIEPTVFSPAI